MSSLESEAARTVCGTVGTARSSCKAACRMSRLVCPPQNHLGVSGPGECVSRGKDMNLGGSRVLWVEFCPSQVPVLKSPPPLPWNVTVSRNEVITDVVDRDEVIANVIGWDEVITDVVG